ncbi:MAG: phosphatidate cytidylyltransferase [Bifidobacteriaceae bacterium]|jgi:phosphatidate cytidylyltransferase|nr:phosphatidate cytidylyltransferase [Bifidobacteriaceae bacterium]
MAKYSKTATEFRNIPLATVTGVVLFLLLFACLFITPYLFLGLVFIACIIAVGEVYYCLKIKNIRIGLPPIIIGSAGMILVSFYYGSGGLSVVYFLTVAVLILYCSLDHIDYKAKIQQVSYSVLICTWIPFLASFLILTYCLPFGAYKLALSSVIISFIDLGGLVIGSHFGKHALAPQLSPKKTWEGFAGGLVFGIVTILLSSAGFEFMNIYFLQTSVFSLKGVLDRLLFALCACIFGLIGDLAESSLKRFAKVKDMSTLLAGHGGIMDRIDSTLIFTPVLYLLFLFLG